LFAKQILSLNCKFLNKKYETLDRSRTFTNLTLSVSGIIVGSMYALAQTDSILTPTEVFNWRLFGFAILT
jgi:hypothetical protein